MYILLVVIVFLLGVSLTAAGFYRRERDLAEVAVKQADHRAEKSRMDALTAVQNSAFYQRQAQYWQGVAYGGKAAEVYNMALQSAKEGSGFVFKGKNPKNVTVFPVTSNE